MKQNQQIWLVSMELYVQVEILIIQNEQIYGWEDIFLARIMINWDGEWVRMVSELACRASRTEQTKPLSWVVGTQTKLTDSVDFPKSVSTKNLAWFAQEDPLPTGQVQHTLWGLQNE